MPSTQCSGHGIENGDTSLFLFLCVPSAVKSLARVAPSVLDIAFGCPPVRQDGHFRIDVRAFWHRRRDMSWLFKQHASQHSCRQTATVIGHSSENLPAGIWDTRSNHSTSTVFADITRRIT
jgi:hypothetical protein